MNANRTMSLYREAKTGDTTAVARLLEMYEPLVVKYANRWRLIGIEDARQEAYVAILLAIDTFDPTRGIYFGAFLTRYVRGHLRTWGRREIRWLERNVVYSHGDDDERSSPIEQWADTKSDDWMLDVEWKEWMSGLSRRERFVIEQNVINGWGMDELARREGVSPHTVRTWKRRALKKLRQHVPTLRHVGALYEDEPL